MRKRDFISMLVKETAKNIVRGEDSWRKYLNTVSRIYKYPFWEQLCIYAQRPDAEACASIEIWNEVMHCWVNRRAKGIALLDEEMLTGLRYVFDISDVHRSGYRGRFPYLWKMKEEHEEAVIKRLEEAELVEAISFPYIYEFNTLGTVCGLGDSVSSLAKDVLMEIGKVIRAFDREQEKNRAAQKSFAKIQNKLESIHTNDYNTLKRESKGLKTEEAQNGTEIREERGLPDSGTAGGRTAGSREPDVKGDNISYNISLPVRRAIFLQVLKKPCFAGFPGHSPFLSFGNKARIFAGTFQS